MTVSRTFAIAAALGTILVAGAVTYAHSNNDHDNFSQPTTLWTPPLIPAGDNTELDCYIINVSKKPRFVVIDALDRDGKKVVDSWSGVVQPGHEEVNKARASATVKPRSCRFIVEGNASQFRASGLVVLDGVGSISALPAE